MFSLFIKSYQKLPNMGIKHFIKAIYGILDGFHWYTRTMQEGNLDSAYLLNGYLLFGLIYGKFFAFIKPYKCKKQI